MSLARAENASWVQSEAKRDLLFRLSAARLGLSSLINWKSALLINCHYSRYTLVSSNCFSCIYENTLVYLSWTLIKACRALTPTPTPHSLINTDHVLSDSELSSSFLLAFDWTLHLKCTVLDHLFRGVRVLCGTGVREIGVTWLWAQVAVSAACREPLQRAPFL